MTMRLRVNGEERRVDPSAIEGGDVTSSSVPARAALQHLGFDLQWMAVAVNGEAVPRSQLDGARLRDGDEVEVLSPMAGG